MVLNPKADTFKTGNSLSSYSFNLLIFSYFPNWNWAFRFSDQAQKGLYFIVIILKKQFRYEWTQ